MRYEVFTLGKHFLQVHTSKGFTLFANAKLNPNGEVVSYTDTLVRRGGSWVIDCYKFLTVKEFPQNPIYCAVFGFEDDDNEVRVNATDIDVESISGVNGQLVDIGNISLAPNQSLAVNQFGGREVHTIYCEYDKEFNPINIPPVGVIGTLQRIDGIFQYTYQYVGENENLRFNNFQVNGYTHKLSVTGWDNGEDPKAKEPFVLDTFQLTFSNASYFSPDGHWWLEIHSSYNLRPMNTSRGGLKISAKYLYGQVTLITFNRNKVYQIVF